MPTCTQGEPFLLAQAPTEAKKELYSSQGINGVSVCHSGGPRQSERPSTKPAKLQGTAKEAGRADQACHLDLPEVRGREGVPSPPMRTVRVAHLELALCAVQSQAPKSHGQVVDTQAAFAVDVEGLEKAPKAQLVVRAPADGAAARVHGRRR